MSILRRVGDDVVAVRGHLGGKEPFRSGYFSNLPRAQIDKNLLEAPGARETDEAGRLFVRRKTRERQEEEA